MTYEAINFSKKFALFAEQWQPRRSKLSAP
jgi:hypothetical protein